MISKKLFAAFLLLVAFAQTASAVTRKEIPNGWYGENLPTGEFAVAVPSQSKLVTHVGEIPFGPEPPLYVRITNVGGFKFAGQGHVSGQTMEWAGSWVVKPNSCGVSPLIYDAAGVLHLSDCSIGSQGWRYVADDGTLVTGDQSFASPIFHLFEFTTHGDVTIGQGGNGGAIAVTPAGRFVLEPGHTTFIRYSRTGNSIAVTIVKLLEAKTVLLWMDASELASFPREAEAPPAPPAPTPIPTPTPAPVPAPEALLAPNRESVVADVIRDHPEINACSETERGAIVDYAAQRLNKAEGRVIWGRKSRNSAGTDLNTDGLTYLRPDGKFEIYDAVGGGSCKSTWDGFGPFNPGQNGFWVAPVLPAEGGPISGPPEDSEIAELKRQLAEARAEFIRVHTNDWLAIEALQTRQRELEIERDDLKAQLVETRREIEELKSKPAPTCEARVPGFLKALGFRFGCTVK